LKVRINVMYQNSGATYIQTLAESKNFIDFLNKLELVAAIQAKADVEFKKKLAVEKRDTVKEKAEQSLKALNELSVARSKLDSQINSIKQSNEPCAGLCLAVPKFHLTLATGFIPYSKCIRCIQV